MKHPLLRLFLAALLVAGLTPPRAGASVAVARSSAEKFIEVIEEGGPTFEEIGQGTLARGESAVLRTTLYKGNSYTIVAAGCEEATDVDVAIYDEELNLVRKDETRDRLASLEGIAPRYTGTFYIKVTMYESASEGAHYVVLLGN